MERKFGQVSGGHSGSRTMVSKGSRGYFIMQLKSDLYQTSSVQEKLNEDSTISTSTKARQIVYSCLLKEHKCVYIYGFRINVTVNALFRRFCPLEQTLL